MPSWDPAVYGRYAAERSRPFSDLMARVDVEHSGTVVDLGCGSGELTASLAARWPDADVLGIDSSPAMIERSAQAQAPNLRFELGDLAQWSMAQWSMAQWSMALWSGTADLLVTNAALQWVPNHLDLLPQWAERLAPGGQLALQVPGNFDAPSHVLMRELAAEPDFRGALAGVLRGGDSAADALTYTGLLAGAGCTVDAWETTYLHVLAGEDAVLEWVRGTGLRPVLDALAGDPELSARFVSTYAGRLRAAYPRQPYGTPFAFRRVFAVARRR